MKQLCQNKKIIIAITALLLVVGVILALTIGFNVELKYKATQRIELSLGKEFEKNDIKNIANEVIGQENIVEKINEDEDAVAIIAEEISDEQKSEIVNKINEKYELEINNENVEINNIPQLHIRDMLYKYVSTFLITGGIIGLYLFVRYYKIGAVKVIGTTAIVSVATQCILFSILAITRIPIGRLTIPLIISVFAFTLYGLTIKYENDLKGIEE